MQLRIFLPVIAVIIYVLCGLSFLTALALNCAAKLLAVTSVFAHPADRPSLLCHGPDVLKGWDMFRVYVRAMSLSLSHVVQICVIQGLVSMCIA